MNDIFTTENMLSLLYRQLFIDVDTDGIRI